MMKWSRPHGCALEDGDSTMVGGSSSAWNWAYVAKPLAVGQAQDVTFTLKEGKGLLSCCGA